MMNTSTRGRGTGTAISVLIIFLMSCNYAHDWASKVNDVNGMLSSFKKEISIKGEVFLDDSVHLLNPFTIKIIGNYLLTENILNGEGKLISVYDMTFKRHIGDFLSHGKGPNEFLYVHLCKYDDDTIMALDVYRKEAQLFSTTKIQECDPVPDRQFNYELNEKGDQVYQCLCLDKHKQIICSGQFMQGRFQSFDLNGRFLEYFGDYPGASYNGKLDNYHFGFVYGTDASLVSNMKQDKFACSGEYAVCIYQKSSGSFKRLFEVQWNVPAIQEASYRNGKPYVLRNADDMVGAGNLAATEKYFFAPFSAYSHRDVIKQSIENKYGYILVFDWDGSPIVKLKLDKEIQFPLEIDTDAKFLYSIHTDLRSGFARIVRFNLSCLDNI